MKETEDLVNTKLNLEPPEYAHYLNDIHALSSEIDSFYTHYAKRIKDLSEALSKEKSKEKLYQIEIAGNHETIQILNNQLQSLQRQLNNNKKEHRIGKINTIKSQENESVLQIGNIDNPDNTKEIVKPIPVSTRPVEISVIQYNDLHDEKDLMRHLKNEFITLIIHSHYNPANYKQHFSLIDMYIDFIYREMEMLNYIKEDYLRKKTFKRWMVKMWNFFWGKEQTNSSEVIKRLENIEKQLLSYANQYEELKKTFEAANEHEDMSSRNLSQMNQLKEELKDIEEYYEGEIQSLKQKLNSYQLKESDLLNEISKLNESMNANNGDGESLAKEIELNRELEKLRKQLKAQSNNNNELYKKLKPQSKKKLNEDQLLNKEFEEYGHIPLPDQSKRTMFDPNKYNR